MIRFPGAKYRLALRKPIRGTIAAPVIVFFNEPTMLDFTFIVSRDDNYCIGIIIPDDGIEDYVREVGGLPERLENNDSVRMLPQKQNSYVNPGKDEDDEGNPTAIKEAKHRLGRDL